MDEQPSPPVEKTVTDPAAGSDAPGDTFLSAEAFADSKPGDAAAPTAPRDPIFVPGSGGVTSALPPLPTSLPASERYEFHEEIARGGMGSIVRGRDRILGRDLAVKFVLPAHKHRADVVKRLFDEARVGGRLQHPGIVPVYELGVLDDERPYFTMKLVQGRTLASLLAERAHSGEDLPRFLAIFEGICQTLAYAHARQVIHRDLKPSNVMVGEFGEVQVMDWGLAKVLGPAGSSADPAGAPNTPVFDGGSAGLSSSQATLAGSVLGTLAYMPPEQARGDVAAVDTRADVFSLGAILCEILTGKPPYVGRPAEVFNAARAGDLDEAQERLAQCGADLELVRIARAALQADREKRLHDASQIAEAIVAFRRSIEDRLQRSQLERAQAETRAVEERKRRRVTLALAASIVALVSVGSISWVLVDRERSARAATLAVQTTQVNQEIAETLHEAEELAAVAASTPSTSATAVEPWEAAQKMVGRAESMLANPLADHRLAVRTAGLRKQVEFGQRRAQFVTFLDELRMKQSRINPETQNFDRGAALSLYPELFRSADVDAEMLAAEESARRISSSLGDWQHHAVAALDDWRITLDLYRAQVPDAERLARWIEAVVARLDDDPIRRRFRRAVAAGETAEAVGLARESGIVDQPPLFLVALATWLDQRGENGAAIDLLLRGFDRHPHDFWINNQLGIICLNADDRVAEVGLRHLAIAVALRDDAGTRVNLGTALLRTGDLAGAIAQYRKSLEREPDFILAESNLSSALAQSNDFQAALVHARRAHAARPENRHYAGILGNILLELGQYEEGELLLRQALQGPLDPAQRTNYLGRLARMMLLQKRARDAQLLLEQAPDDVRTSDLVGTLGDAYRHQGLLPFARDAYRKAIALDDKNAMAHHGLSLVLSALGDRQGAVAHAGRACELDPENPIFASDYGGRLLEAGRIDEAAEKFQAAIALAPDLAEPHYNYGTLLLNTGKFEQALEQLTRAAELNPQHAESHCNIGFVLNRLGRYAEARDAMRRGHALGSERPGWSYPSAAWLAEAERLAELEQKLEEVLKNGVESADAGERLLFGIICYRKKRYADAVVFYAGAFRVSTETASDLAAGHRQFAIRAAVLASLQAEEQGDAVAAAARATRAREWLADELAQLARESGMTIPPDRVRARIKGMLADSDLARFREEERLERMPSSEREAWKKVWDDAEALLQP